MHYLLASRSRLFLTAACCLALAACWGARFAPAAGQVPLGADALAVISERALAETARQLIGLEIKLANGALLRLTGIETEIKPAAALVRLAVQARPAPDSPTAVSLQLTGRLESGTGGGAAWRMPFRIDRVALASAPASWLSDLLSDWLSPQRWDAALPPLEIPLELSETLEIPAGRFDVGGEFPMEIATPASRVRVDLIVSALHFLDGRAALALRLAPAPPGPAAAAPPDAATLAGEVARLGRELPADRDLLLCLRRPLINALLEQVASAHQTDLTIRLKPSRIRSEQTSGTIQVLNYTDVEGGDGRADVRQLRLERLAGGLAELRLEAQGELTARLRGREYGIPYRLSPTGLFAIDNQALPLEIVNEGDQLLLRARPGSRLPTSVSLGLNLAGQRIAISHTIELPADRWLSRIVLPNFFDRELLLPNRLEVAEGGGARTAGTRPLRYILSQLDARIHDDAVNLSAILLLRSPESPAK